MRPVFVMIKCDLGKAYEVADEVSDRIEETSEVHSTSGEYDLLVKFYLPDEGDVGRFVCERVQTLPHVRGTYTIISFKVFGR
jgi:DNA-binding Lrp family transcriptional regulator